MFSQKPPKTTHEFENFHPKLCYLVATSFWSLLDLNPNVKPLRPIFSSQPIGLLYFGVFIDFGLQCKVSLKNSSHEKEGATTHLSRQLISCLCNIVFILCGMYGFVSGNELVLEVFVRIVERKC